MFHTRCSVSHRRGFTLIELMVTVAIIGILMAAGIVAFSNSQKAARDAKRRADVDALGKAFEQYYASNNHYGGNLTASSQGAAWNGTPLNTFFPEGKLPVDPLNTGVYSLSLIAILYNPGYVNPASRFCVYARLEKSNGNCTGYTNNNGTGDPNSYKCAFVTPGTGTHYCVQNRQ